MNVARIHDAGGSHIEPPLNQSWDDFTKLRWHAAVVAHDTGLHIEVREGGLSRLVDDEWQPVPGTYSVTVGCSSGGGHDFQAAWIFLVGISVGAEQATQAAPENHPTGKENEA